jgi:hypothetical protein
MNDRYSALRPTAGATTVMDGAAHRALRNTYLASQRFF